MLQVNHLTRRYGDATALDDVSFEVRPGRMTGFVGANGAGKTTTMRIIVGVLAPTSGTVTWGGEELTTEQRRRFGYMPEERGLYPKMRLRDQLTFFGRLHGMTATQAHARATDLLTRLGLGERIDDVLETLSLGNQQRVQVAAALVHHPTALILDEPFSGLDPLAVDTMVELLSSELSPDLPVLFSSHQLELVERLCDDLVILSGGRVVAAGPVEALRDQEAPRYRVVVAEGGVEQLRSAGLTLLSTNGSEAVVEGNGQPADQLLDAVRRAAPVSEFSRVVRPLSQIYRDVIA
ncbi:ABC transporter ATP-binding protein [Nocardioides caldifontis]|uniref:ABC transporter ATP-binding protein n=1 Tax=Nocardioides caldifontis TaxID=2588938 RepID=UPI0011E02677|nr:ATP-binding cassette domain-containing protein [Nocardioides caldifontis]